MRRLTVGLLLAAIAAAGCQYPRDPDGTLNRVEGGVMRVGVTEADPWVLLDGDRPVGGAEVELARRFARELGARIEWVQGFIVVVPVREIDIPSPGVTVVGQDSSLSGSQ